MSTGTPDSEARHFESIEVRDTAQHDNPKFGSVTLRLNRPRMSEAVRMSREDAEDLANKLVEYLSPFNTEKDN